MLKIRTYVVILVICFQTFLPIMVKEGQRKRDSSADRPSIIMVGSFAGKVRLSIAYDRDLSYMFF